MGRLSEPPLVKLTNAILLSAIKHRAKRVRVRADTAEYCLVEFLIEGAYREEMRPPTTLLAAIVRRFSIMANLPMYPRGGAAEGFIHLQIGDYRAAYFAIVVDGYGDAMRAILEEITEEDYNSAKSSGSTDVYR
jgi:type II secretory ATPase GspE/PulE/Tfp pilus assembly ATPase PilB-like protein